MESYRIENLSFTYPNAEKKALDGINLVINQGEFITVTGKSGCGKTTLLRLLKSSLSPFGISEGNILFLGEQLDKSDQKRQASKIGFVLQSPENQIVTDKVWHELAFGLESLGVSTSEIRTRVAEMASFFGIQEWFYKNTSELSGGQKQILNLASVMVMQPCVLILDEPTSQLDPISASEFLKILEKINRELGTTVILTEHRLEDVFPISDRIAVMDQGVILACDTPKSVGEILKNKKHDMYDALPTPMRVWGAISNDSECPVTVREGRCMLEKVAQNKKPNASIIPRLKTTYEDKKTIVEIRDAWFKYEKNLPDVVKGLNVEIYEGEIFAVVGGNGTGKTTTLSLISGINTPYRGKVFIDGNDISKTKNLYHGQIGSLPQNPQSVFVKKTVSLDLAEILFGFNLSKEEKKRKIYEVAELCQITHLLERHPYDLSGGEQQRAALAKVLLTEPKILILDEPTKGMDAHFKKVFSQILLNLKKRNVTIVMVSHDLEFCAEYADRCAMFFDGEIVCVAPSREFFSGKSFYTTAANRMARTILPEAVLTNDIVLAFGGKTNTEEERVYDDFSKKNSIMQNSGKNKENESDKKSDFNFEKTDCVKKEKLTKKMMWSLFAVFLAIPFTVYAGVAFLGDRKYYFISLLIILEILFPFCFAFESRKPQARELIIISVLCAVAVAGRAVFYMTPQFKPVAAIVIVSGVCFGAETGFLVGAVTGFVSNFLFGQGPWTPWQMISFGIVGFLAGILFNMNFLKKTKVSICIFGFLATFLLYGGIMNFSTLVISQTVFTREMLFATYFAGVSFDLVHAFSTAFFLWFIAKPMIEKLERVKIKYGIIDGR